MLRFFSFFFLSLSLPPSRSTKFVGEFDRGEEPEEEVDEFDEEEEEAMICEKDIVFASESVVVVGVVVVSVSSEEENENANGCGNRVTVSTPCIGCVILEKKKERKKIKKIKKIKILTTTSVEGYVMWFV